MSFSDKYTVKQARLLAGLTQKEMAEHMSVHRDTYRKIEINPELATIEQARLFAQIVGRPMDDIIFARDSTQSRVS